MSLSSSSSWSTRGLAIHYTTTLAASSPEMQAILLDLKADKELRRLYRFAYDRMGDIDHLLSPARRALAVFSDTEVLSLAREWEDLWDVSPRITDVNGVPMKFHQQQRVMDAMFGILQ